MTKISWKKHEYKDGFCLNLTYEIDNKTFTGCISYEKFSRPILGKEDKAVFTFQSLGIAGKKIDTKLTEEEMKEEALMFLKKKAEARIKELNGLVGLIEGQYEKEAI